MYDMYNLLSDDLMMTFHVSDLSSLFPVHQIRLTRHQVSNIAAKILGKISVYQIFLLHLFRRSH